MLPQKAIYGYITEYSLIDSYNKERIFFSYVLAKNLKQAKNLIEQRNLQERIVSKRLNLSNQILKKISIEDNEYFLNKKNHLNILHYICFLSYICLQSNKLKGEEILSDVSILHEGIHFFNSEYKKSDKKETLENLKLLLNNLESKSIGVFPEI
jgi:thiaminase